jgi:mannonate dehydratase
MRRRVILNAACVEADAPSIDRAYVERLATLARDFPEGARWLLYAFDHAYGDDGRRRDDWSTFHVPNDYAAAVARAHAHRFEWVASIHPYRDDALEQLDAAIAAGARALKWLPSAMNIDLRSPRVVAFHDRLAAARLPLIVHCGEEVAVPGARRGAYGNPLHVRVPLERGVRVIVAHAASLGRADDLDRASRPRVPAFDLLSRLLDEPQWQPLLRADISALFQVNRSPHAWRAVLRRADWHARLLHGSDYPLPGVPSLTSPGLLAAEGLLDETAVALLRRIREHNALLFDFVLKRHLRDGSARLDAGVFETRRHFVAAGAAVSASRRRSMSAPADEASFDAGPGNTTRPLDIGRAAAQGQPRTVAFRAAGR